MVAKLIVPDAELEGLSDSETLEVVVGGAISIFDDGTRPFLRYGNLRYGEEAFRAAVFALLIQRAIHQLPDVALTSRVKSYGGEIFWLSAKQGATPDQVVRQMHQIVKQLVAERLVEVSLHEERSTNQLSGLVVPEVLAVSANMTLVAMVNAAKFAVRADSDVEQLLTAAS